VAFLAPSGIVVSGTFEYSQDSIDADASATTATTGKQAWSIRAAAAEACVVESVRISSRACGLSSAAGAQSLAVEDQARQQ